MSETRPTRPTDAFPADAIDAMMEASVGPSAITIGGASRSGSTLLGLLLGQAQRSVVVGELRYIWSRGCRQNMLCGCGTPFGRCDFWRSVLGRVYGSLERAPALELERLQDSIAQIWHLPAILGPVRSRRFDRRMASYVEHLGALSEAIRDVSGCSRIIDSSKLPSYCALLARTNGPSALLIHLVRDSRAVAFSFLKKKRKPDVHWREAYMKRFSPFESSLDWNGLNLGMELIRRSPLRTKFLRYEDVAHDPGSALRELLPHPVGQPPERTQIELDVTHTVSGNPLRFTQGELEVRPDDDWRRWMDVKDRRIVTAMTVPLLIRYGYPVSAHERGGPAHSQGTSEPRTAERR